MNTHIYIHAAIGISGFHAVRTALRFTIDGKDIKDMEVIELGPKHIKG